MYELHVVVFSDFSVPTQDLEAVALFLRRVRRFGGRSIRINSEDPVDRHEARVVLGPCRETITKDMADFLKAKTQELFGILDFPIRILSSKLVETTAEEAANN